MTIIRSFINRVDGEQLLSQPKEDLTALVTKFKVGELVGIKWTRRTEIQVRRVE